MSLDQDKMLSLMREILQEDYLELVVERYTLDERLEEGRCRISCVLKNATGGKSVEVEGEGVGTIDAVFNALRNHLAEDYPSLKSIQFPQLVIRGLIDTEDGESTKAEAEATVGIVNSEGREFVFQTQQPSVSQAGVQATVEAAEYFVNSERTYVRLHEILTHYQEEGRTDLVEKYTDLMSQVVQVTSYSEVVEKIRASMK